MRRGEVCKQKRGSRETARLTATSTSVGDDLPDALELSGEGFVSATGRRAPAGEREWRGGKCERGEASRGGLEL
jgi:hypothetical protein